MAKSNRQTLPLARLHTLCHDPHAKSYRVHDGQYQRRCSQCRKWLPASAFFVNATYTALHSYCMTCQAARDHQRAAQAGSITPSVPSSTAAPAPHLLPVLDEDSRTCRHCGLLLPLVPECWPPRPDGGLAHLCHDCTNDLRSRSRAALRGTVPWEVRHVPA